MNKIKFKSLDDHLIEINRIIQQHGLSTNNHGLMHGNTGLSIYFYHLSRTANNPEYEQIADDLLDKVFSSLSTFASPDFENGLAGIGWGIEYLVQNGFAEGDADEILEEVDNKIFKTLQGDNLTSFELMDGLTGYLFYLVSRLKNPLNTDSMARHINRELLILIINKLDVLVTSQIHSIVHEMHFDLFWRFPLMLYGLSEAFKLNVYNEKIKRMIKQWSYYLETYIPSMHINRLYMATILTKINALIHDSRIERQICILLHATDFKALESEIDYNLLNIRYGALGASWLLYQASQIVSVTCPNHSLIDLTYKKMAGKIKIKVDNIQINRVSEDKQLGISQGIAGIGLMKLLSEGILWTIETPRPHDYHDEKLKRRSKKALCDVVILSNAKTEKLKALTQQAIDTLLISERIGTFNIIVIEQTLTTFPKVQTIHLPGEFNYNRFANFGIEKGQAPWICVANNDLVFGREWFSEMMKIKSDVMSPKNPGDMQQADITVPQKGFVAGRNFSGWCFVMKRRIWEKIGGLDEDFSFWCADNATVEQLKAIQVQPMLIPSSQVKHFASATLRTLDKAEYVEKTKIQVLKFNRKYNQNLFNLGK